MKITVGIPSYKAQSTICRCLSSIQIQTFPDIEVIIAKDAPDDDYSFVLDRYPDMDIKILDCEKNTGPGLARQRALDAATGDWITFIDADDVFYTPYALATLAGPTIDYNVIETEGMFLQEVTDMPDGTHLLPQQNPNHPWVFGRLYSVGFLRENKIAFSELRAMEDGEFNWKVNLIIEGTNFTIALLDEPVYVWKEGSEHSITRIGVEDGIPQYNFDLCPLGATEAAIRSINFCRKVNPFNPAIMKFAVEQMVDKYFTYIECCEKKPVFKEQNFFVAKKFYNECYKEYEHLIDDEILKNIYTTEMVNKSQDLINIIPTVTFFDFFKKVKNSNYEGQKELDEIRAALPEEIINNDKKSGVIQ